MEPQPQHTLPESELKDIWNSLALVGPEKPVGYLPIDTIETLLKKDWKSVATELHQKGLEVRIAKGGHWPGGPKGSLYVFDKQALQQLLDEHRDILEEADWPTDAEAFVHHLHVTAPAGSPLYKLIAKAFADKFTQKLVPEDFDEDYEWKTPGKPAEIDIGWPINEQELWELDVPVEKMPLNALAHNLDLPYLEQEGTDDWNLTPRMLIEHMDREKTHAEQVQRADTSFPIDIYKHHGQWIIVDGVHRFTKAAMEGLDTIPVRKHSEKNLIIARQLDKNDG